MPEGTGITLTARHDDELLGEGEVLHFSGFRISINQQDHLQVTSEQASPMMSFELEVALSWPDGASESQKLEVRPAPPNRPISYVADFIDDIISIFQTSNGMGFRNIEKSAFDQYFRRLQAQGITRLIVWLFPFPFIVDPGNYPVEDWDRYEKQARAILESKELTKAFQEHGKSVSWVWIRKQLELRLMKNFGALLSDSAIDHGISLTVSFRPFEAAVTKFINPVPVFDSDGRFLWNFLPIATPIVNYHPDQACFAHYRTILGEMGLSDFGKIDTIEIPGVQNADAFLKRFLAQRDNLKILASEFAPLREDTFVLRRRQDGSFETLRFREIQPEVEKALHVVTGYNIEPAENDSLRITGLDVPNHCGFILLTNPAEVPEALDLSAREPVRLYSKTGTRLGRKNVWWVLNDSTEQRRKTLVAGISPENGDNTDFFTTERSLEFLRAGPGRLQLIDNILVIDRGAPWSVEMMDFNQAPMRQNVVRELRTVLSYPAFDEIFINTRSHTQLAGYMGDGELGIRPGAWYRDKNMNYKHLGIDLAYAPRTVARAARFRKLASDPSTVEQITTNQAGEWNETCQSPDSPYCWRYTRNQEIAQGVRKLLVDLQQTFPGVRIRAVIPERERVFHAVKEEVAKDSLVEDTEQNVATYGQLYGLDWYHNFWRRTNHIPSLCEGMALLDLTGLSVEPVFLGIRHLPAQRPLDFYLRECIKDMTDNHGSDFQGPRSFFYETNPTFSFEPAEQARRRREQIVCYLLSHKRDINEVILYEAATLVWHLDISDPDLYGHGFLDHADEILSELDIP